MALAVEPKLLIDSLAENIGRVIVGKDGPIELALVALVSRGHVLIEDVPGVGKTMLARSLAISTGCTFRRMQFTPDLLPSDVTGASIFNQQTREFEFRPGPVISEIVLADEINRATPKTQSALLEAMGERQVTVDGVTRPLPRPFMVLATQNPIEYEGTFPLPEAQLDRFMLRIRLGYPGPEDEVEMMSRQQTADPILELGPVCTPADVVELQDRAREVYVDDLVKRYVVSLVGATRGHEEVALGASPRASLALMQGAQAMAMVRERDYVVPDDVKAIAEAAMAHRVLLSPSARMRGVTQEEVVRD
ncbi:MAG: MoxR family ATPase, partial [Gemmatimonadetes bacterium]|nr:MoxR family ATPase [Gemmatimonadota bacterium]